MEYLDYYDEFDNYLGYETREIVHQKGLWHKTVHNWLYTTDGKAIFQIRSDSNKFYTTSSGHVDKGETVEEAFKRETLEEIGVSIDPESAKLISIVPWQMDKVKKDGSILKDRAKASIFIAPYMGSYEDFRFDPKEVLGVVFVDAQKTLDLFKKGTGQIDATIVKAENRHNTVTNEKVSIDDFLVMPGENCLEKYGYVLEAIVSATAVNN